MPRLNLYANSGFPFTRLADLAETAVVLPENPNAYQIETYLQTLAFLGARTGYPGLRVTVLDSSQAAGVRNKDLLVLSGMDRSNLPAAWENELAIQRQNGQSAVTERRRLMSFLPCTRSAAERSHLEERLSASPPPEAILQEFASPADPERVVAVIQTAARPDQSPLLTIFGGGAAVAGIYGDVSVYQDDWFHSFQILPGNYHIGHLGWHANFDYWVGQHFLVIPAILLICASLLAFVVDGWLKRRSKWRLHVES